MWFSSLLSFHEGPERGRSVRRRECVCVGVCVVRWRRAGRVGRGGEETIGVRETSWVCVSSNKSLGAHFLPPLSPRHLRLGGRCTVRRGRGGDVRAARRRRADASGYCQQLSAVGVIPVPGPCWSGWTRFHRRVRSRRGAGAVWRRRDSGQGGRQRRDAHGCRSKFVLQEWRRCCSLRTSLCR